MYVNTTSQVFKSRAVLLVPVDARHDVCGKQGCVMCCPCKTVCAVCGEMPSLLFDMIL